MNSPIASSASSNSSSEHGQLERRLGRDHRVPVGGRVEPAREHLGLVAEQLHEVRIELGAAAVAGDRYGGVEASAAVEDLDHVGEVDHPRGHLDVVALQLERAAAVPRLECLPEALANLLAQPQTLRQLVGGEVMVLEHVLQRTAPVAQKQNRDPTALERRPARTANIPKREGRRRAQPRHVMEPDIVLEPDVVAKPLGLLVGIGVTADPGEQTRVVEDAALALVQPETLRHPQRDQALTDHVLHRLAETQVGPQRQERDQLREPNPCALRRWSHGPSLRSYR